MSFPMKIVMIGDPIKSDILEFYGKVFRSDFTLIEGPDFAFKVMNIGGNTFNFQVWQLPEDPSFKIERSRYYYGALGAIIVFNVNNLESYRKIPSWLEEIWTHNGMGKTIPIVLVGIKIHERTNISESISDEDTSSFTNEINQKQQANITYIPVDEHTGENVAQIWENLGNWFIEHLQQLES